MRVLAIAQFLRTPGRNLQCLAKIITCHPARNGRIITRGPCKDAGGEAAPQCGPDITISIQCGNDLAIIGRVAHHSDKFMVLGRCPQHGRSANIDGFDQCGRIIGARQLRFKRVEIDGDEIDIFDPLFTHCGQMRIIVAPCQQAAMDMRMQRLYAPVHDFGKAGDIRYIRYGNAGIAQHGRRATG